MYINNVKPLGKGVDCFVLTVYLSLGTTMRESGEGLKKYQNILEVIYGHPFTECIGRGM